MLSAYLADICFPLTSMLSVTLSQQTGRFLLAQMSIASVFRWPQLSPRLSHAVVTLIFVCAGWKHSRARTLCKKNVLILEQKSFADVGSFLHLCTSLSVAAKLDSNFSSSYINTPLWSSITSLGFFKQLIESASMTYCKVKWFSSSAQLACYVWEVPSAFIHQPCLSP